MVRMHQEYSEEIENFLSHQTCSHEPPPLYNAAVGGSSGGNYGGGVKYNSIDTNNNNNTSSSFEHDQHHHCYERGFYLGSAIGYRFGVGKVYEEKLRYHSFLVQNSYHSFILTSICGCLKYFTAGILTSFLTTDNVITTVLII